MTPDKVMSQCILYTTEAPPLKMSGCEIHGRRHRPAPQKTRSPRRHRPIHHEVTLDSVDPVHCATTIKTMPRPHEKGMSLSTDQPLPNDVQTHEESLTLRAPPREKASTVVRSTIASGLNAADARKNKKKRNSMFPTTPTAQANSCQKTRFRKTC